MFFLSCYKYDAILKVIYLQCGKSSALFNLDGNIKLDPLVGFVFCIGLFGLVHFWFIFCFYWFYFFTLHTGPAICFPDLFLFGGGLFCFFVCFVFNFRTPSNRCNIG